MYELTHEQRALADAALTNKLNVIHHVYVDITGDLIAGALLGQILYWFGADRNGKPRARIKKDGHLWIAKGRADWWDEIRISAKQYDRAAKILKEKGFIEIRTMKFNGNPTSHVRIIPEALNKAIDEWRYLQVANVTHESVENVAVVGFSPFGNNDIPQTGNAKLPEQQQRHNPIENNHVAHLGISLTETTAKNTNENTAQNTRIKARELLFNEIWDYYPRKVGRSKAQRAYIEALGKGVNPYHILVEVALYRQWALCALEHEETTTRFIATGGTWFSEERWNDETQRITSKLDYETGNDYQTRIKKLYRLAQLADNAEDEALAALHASINEVLRGLPY